MRNHSSLLLLLLLCLALPAGAQRKSAQQKNQTSTKKEADITLTIHPSQALNTIPREIYGQFAEHLGRCIYGGLWVGKDSEIPNIEGYRADVFEALKALEVPVIRWPGGCFADEYHWMDGVGPQENRPRLVNNNWGSTVEDNSFGTHEFLNLCEMLGAEPYISGNVGSGSVEEMAKWVEYVNSDSESTMANLRRKNGRDKPWKVRFFGVGNESWGCGGQMRPEYYSDLFRRYSIYCRDYSGTHLYKVASGGNADDVNWTNTLMERIGNDKMDGLSVHYYAVTDWGTNPDGSGRKGSATDFTRSYYYRILQCALNIEPALRSHIAAMDKADPAKRVGLLVDEWGTWFNVEPGTNPGWLYQQNTMRDALVASSSLDIFHRYTDRVRMANIAQMVNVLQAMVLTDEKDPKAPCLLTPTYYVFLMYKVHRDALYLPTDMTCPRVGDDGYEIPAISYTASTDPKGNMHLSVSNLDMDQERVVTVSVDNMQIKRAEGEILSSKDIHDFNQFGYSSVFTTKYTGAMVADGRLILTIPAHSVVTLSIE